jgi:hypothetical protein
VTTPALHRPVWGGTRGTTRPGNAPLRGAEEVASPTDPVAVPGAGHVGALDVSSSAPPPERCRTAYRHGRAVTPGEGGADPQAAEQLHPYSAAPCWGGGLEFSPSPRRQSIHPAGSTSTLAGPRFGPKNGVHLSLSRRLTEVRRGRREADLFGLGPGHPLPPSPSSGRSIPLSSGSRSTPPSGPTSPGAPASGQRSPGAGMSGGTPGSFAGSSSSGPGNLRAGVPVETLGLRSLWKLRDDPSIMEGDDASR